MWRVRKGYWVEMALYKHVIDLVTKFITAFILFMMVYKLLQFEAMTVSRCSKCFDIEGAFVQYPRCTIFDIRCENRKQI